MILLRKFYFTCPAVPQAMVLCQADVAAPRLLAQECLMCGQTHVLDSFERTVIEMANDQRRACDRSAA